MGVAKQKWGVASNVSGGDSLDGTLNLNIQAKGHQPSENLESCPGKESAAVFPILVVLYSTPCKELPSDYTHFQVLWIAT